MELLHWRIHFYIFNYAAVLHNFKIQTQQLCYLSAPALRCGTTSDCILQNEFHGLVEGYIKIIPVYITSNYNFDCFFTRT
jgi:hypothetical protein